MIAWSEREDVTVPLDPVYHGIKCGTVVRTENGEEWTVVYRGLGGFGVVAGRQDYTPSTPNEELPVPTAWLRKPHEHLTLENPIGDQVIILSRPEE